MSPPEEGDGRATSRAITPGLGCDPLDRVIAVLLFAPGVGQEWHIILAFGGEPSTEILPDHRIAVTQETV